MKGGLSKAGAWLGCLFLCLYVATSQHGVAWQDSGVFQLRALYRDLYGTNGLACAHPLYIAFANLLGRLLCGFLEIDFPHAANLASALWMSFALVLLFDCALRLSKSRLAAAMATLTLGFSHLAWWLSTIAESYPMSLAFILAEVWCTIRILQGEGSPTIYLQTAVFAGLGFSVHNLSLLSLPATAAAMAFAARANARKSASGNGSAVGLASGAAVLAMAWALSAWEILLPAFRMVRDGASVQVAAADVLLGSYGANVAGVATIPASVMLANLCIAALSLSSPCWMAGAAALHSKFSRNGFRHLLRGLDPARTYCFALLAIHLLFAIRYRVHDQFLFMLPSLALATLLLAVPLAAWLRASRRIFHVALLASVPICAVALPLAANRILHMPWIRGRILASRARSLPHRDEIRYWTLPWKHDEESAEQFASDAIDSLNALGEVSVFADSTSAPPILLRQYLATSNWTVYSSGNDVSRFVAEAESGKTVYAVSPIPLYCPSRALATGNVRPLPGTRQMGGNRGPLPR